MSWLRRIHRRVRALVRPGEMDREMDAELSFHLEMEAAELVRSRGLSPEEARRQAALAFGGVARIREEGHDARGVRVLEDLLADLRYAARGCARVPGFAAAAILTLALGIGASTAIFSVVYGVVLKPLPFAEPGALTSLMHWTATNDIGAIAHGPATYFTYRDNQSAFEGIGAWEAGDASVTGGGDPEQVEVLAVTATTLPLLRVRPALGRLLTAEDDTPGTPLRVVVTHGYWQRRFAGARDVVGQTFAIDGAPAEVVGVLPASFTFPRPDVALVLPMQLDPATATGIEFDFQLLGRLKPGATLAQAQADLARMIPLLPPGFEVLELQPNVRPLADEMIGDVAPLLWILLAAVGVVLLIACGNVANLFLIRAEGRQRELAMRAALGAGRGRIARVLLSESVLLAVAGGALGLVLAQGAIGLLRWIAPVELPRVDEIGIDGTVLLFTLVISVLSGALFGLFAVLKFGRPSIGALRGGGRTSSDAPGRHRARNILAVTQVALALTLMIVSGLMVRTVLSMRQVAPGFANPGMVQTFRVAIPSGLIDDQAEVARTHERIARVLATVPGVVSVGISSSITMDGEDNTNPIHVEDAPVAEGTLPPFRRFKTFAPGYFETMGIPIVAGRSISWSDVHEQRPGIVISETLAREYWGEPSRAIGRRLRWDTDAPWREVVGVVGDERDDGLARPATAIVYWPMLTDPYEQQTMAYAIRSTRVGTPGFQRELQQAVWSVNRDLPVALVQTLDEIQARSMAQTSFAMVMLGIAAVVALLLGVVGIYGVIAYMATQRTREIGIRIALGAQIGDVRALFLRHGLQLTATGIVLGIVAAFALTRLMRALLFGVGPLDPLTYAAVSALLAAVALLATYLPARRASRVAPTVALQSDA